MAAKPKITAEQSHVIIQAWLRRQRLKRIARRIPTDKALAADCNVHLQTVRLVISRYIESLR